jgi:methylation protein EvaC
MGLIPQSLVNNCQACGNHNLTLVHDFGQVALAGYFPKASEIKLPSLEMQLLFCNNCYLYQVNPNIDDDFLFTDYRYVSSIGMSDHFAELANWWLKIENPNRDSKILEIGCNDGPLLHALSNLGFKPIGIDPAKNIIKNSKYNEIHVIEDFFNSSSIEKYKELRDLDYIFSSNSFAHISNINEIAKSVSIALNTNGKFILEVQSFTELVKNNAFDFIYHEHKYYYTILSLENLFSKHGLFLMHGIMIPSHGGSYRLVFSKNKSNVNSELNKLISAENTVDLSISGICSAINRFESEINKTKLFLEQLSRKNRKIIAFGASGRANMILSALGTHKDYIDFVLDESPERIGREMAQFNICIKSFSDFNPDTTEYLLVLAWNYSNAIINKWKNPNTKFIIPLPKFELV